MKYRKLFVIGAVSLAAATPQNGFASSSQELRTALSAARAPELPREVAHRIGELKGKDRDKTAFEIIRLAVEINPASAAAIVGAAAKVAPDLAAGLSATAAAVQPKLAAGIARAAAGSAPAYAPEIAVAVSKKLPAQYASIAYEVAYAAPAKNEQIVHAVVNGFPNLKAFSPAADSGAKPKVTDLVATAPVVETTAKSLGMQTEQFLVATLTPAQQTEVSKVTAKANSNVPRVAFVPGEGTPGEANRPQDFTVTPGKGRDYATVPGNKPR